MRFVRKRLSLSLIFLTLNGGLLRAQENPFLHQQELSNDSEEPGHDPYNSDPTSYCKPFEAWSGSQWEQWRQSLFEATSTDMGITTVAPGTQEMMSVENLHMLMKPLSFCFPQIRKKHPEFFAKGGCFVRTEDIFRLWAMKGEEAQVKGVKAYPVPNESKDEALDESLQKFTKFATKEILEASPNRSERLDDEIRLNEIRLGSEHAPAALTELYARGQALLGIKDSKTPVWATGYKSPVFGEELSKASMTFHKGNVDFFTSINQREDSFGAFGPPQALSPEAIESVMKLTDAENKKKEAHGLSDFERNKLVTMIVSQKVGDVKINRFIMAHNNEGVNLVEGDVATEMSCLRCHMSGKTLDVRGVEYHPTRFPSGNAPKSLEEYNSSLQSKKEERPLTIFSAAERALNQVDWPGLGTDSNIASYCLTLIGKFRPQEPRTPLFNPKKKEAVEKYQRTLTELQTHMNCASCHAKEGSSFALLTPVTAVAPADFSSLEDILEDHVHSGYMPKLKEGEAPLSPDVKNVLAKCVLTQYFGKLYNASSPEKGTFLSEMFPTSCDK